MDAKQEHVVIRLNRERDLARVADLDNATWFDIQTGFTDDDTVGPFDFGRCGAIEMPAAPAFGAKEGLAPLAAVYSAFDMTVTVPTPAGLGSVPMSGLTWVAVHPDQRRRGLLRAMMTDHLNRVHDEGRYAIAGLWAADVGIYGRFGYDVASYNVFYQLGRGTELNAPESIAAQADDLSTQLLPIDTPGLIEAIQDAHVASADFSLGAVTRGVEVTHEFYRDHPKSRGSKEKVQALVVLRKGQVVGYATLRRNSNWDDRMNAAGTVSVSEIAAPDAPTLLAIGRRLTALDLTTKVKVTARGTDDPMMWWAGGPRSTSANLGDALWLRLVDLPQALHQRGYAAPANLVIGVADEACPWNAGRWHLMIKAEGQAQCVRTQEAPDLEIPVQALSSAYLGGRSLVGLAPIHGIVEHSAGALLQLSRAMRSDVEPMATIDF